MLYSRFTGQGKRRTNANDMDYHPPGKDLTKIFL